MTMFRMLVLLAVCGASRSLTAKAQTPPSAVQTLPCGGQTTDAGMRGCEAARYQDATRKLESAYQMLMKQSSPEGKRKLALAEQAWLRFATSNAAFVLTQANGGTMGRLLQVTTLADMAEARTAELQKMLQ